MLRPWLSIREKPADLTGFNFERPWVERALRGAIDSRRHVLVYGPARQGKSLLVRRATEGRGALTLHASRDFGFTDMTRNLLLALGCSVIVEQKRRSKRSTKAEVQLKWPFVSAGGSLQGDAEREQTERNFTAEIGNPNDVCHLLKEMGGFPLLVVERFEQLGSKQRTLLLDFLRVSAENAAMQVILVASAAEMPLLHQERIVLERYLSVVPVPSLAADEMRELADSALQYLRRPAGPELSGTICSIVANSFGGSLEAVIEACTLLAARPFAPLSKPTSGDTEAAAYVASEFRDRARGYLVTLLLAVIEAQWTIPCAERLPQQAVYNAGTEATDDADAAEKDDEDSDEDGVASDEGRDDADREDDQSKDDEDEPGDVLIDPALAADPVFRDLHRQLVEYKRLMRLPHGSAFARLPATERQYLRPIVQPCVDIGYQLLTQPHHLEKIRLLAFAISKLVDDPTGEVDEVYRPAAAPDETTELNMGHLVCEILLAADLTQPVVLNASVLHEYFDKRRLVINDKGRRRHQPEAIIAKFARRLTRLQRKMQVDPPLFTADATYTEVRLWDPKLAPVFGDIKEELRRVLETAELEGEDGA